SRACRLASRFRSTRSRSIRPPCPTARPGRGLPTTAMAEVQSARPSDRLPFSKMHGAGNDFVVLDLRGKQPAPGAALCRALADRHSGVGCDQILTVEDPREAGSVASYRIWNAD